MRRHAQIPRSASQSYRRRGIKPHSGLYACGVIERKRPLPTQAVIILIVAIAGRRLRSESPADFVECAVKTSRG